jgi:hypothetical protein
MESKDAAKVFDTILSAPGMSEVVKIDLKITRKSALLLSSVIQRGLSAKEDDKGGILDNVPKESLQDLTALSDECLQKAGLTELHDKLKALSSK